jgi:hypothetical protein
MIQRIQSIFLLLTSISFFCLFLVPFATSTVAIPQFFNDLVYNVSDHPILIGLTVIGGLISLAAIFLFNNRVLQLKMSYVTTVVGILLPLLVILLVYNEGTFTTQADKIEDKMGIYLPIFSIIFSILAARNIKKDENTVRDMDRLR